MDEESRPPGEAGGLHNDPRGSTIAEPTTSRPDPEAGPLGPEDHKAAAGRLIIREPGKRPRVAAARDLLALSTSKDPFYCGTAADFAEAEWYARLWAEFGGPGTNVRDIHYKAFQLGGTLPDGSPYPNNKDTWQALCSASARARYLGLVDPELITDIRSARPVTGTRPRPWPAEPGAEADTDPAWSLPSLSASIPEATAEIPLIWAHASEGHTDLPGVTVTGYGYDQADQPVLVEVWSEKEAVDASVLPLCDFLRINYVRGKGYLSITRVVELLRRAEQHGRPAHVLYVSDYDPGGENMPRQVARQVQFWRAKLGISEHVTVHPLALTAEQVTRYGLPQAPDSRNVELQALTALHEGELESIIREAVSEWRDPSIQGWLTEAWRDAQDEAGEQWQDATASVGQVARAVRRRANRITRRQEKRLRRITTRAEESAAPLRDRLAQLVAEINATLQPYRDQAAAIQERARAGLRPLENALWSAERRYAQIAAGFDPDLPARPEAECTADQAALLFDSRRDWLTQLNMFRESKGLPPVTEADRQRWHTVYNSLICGNGRDGIGELTDADRRDLIIALARDGLTVPEIIKLTGLPRGIAYKHARRVPDGRA